MEEICDNIDMKKSFLKTLNHIVKTIYWKLTRRPLCCLSQVVKIIPPTSSLYHLPISFNDETADLYSCAPKHIFKTGAFCR